MFGGPEKRRDSESYHNETSLKLNRKKISDNLLDKTKLIQNINKLKIEKLLRNK